MSRHFFCPLGLLRFIGSFSILLTISASKTPSTPDPACLFIQNFLNLPKPVFYHIINTSLGEEIIIETCQDSDLSESALITYNSAKYHDLTFQTLATLLKNIQSEKLISSIFTTNPCPKTQISHLTTSCYKNIRDLSATSDFDDFVSQGNTIPEAINIFITDADYELYNYMATQLVLYETPNFESCYEPITFMMSIENIMSFDFYSYQNSSVINSIYSLTSKISCSFNDYNEYTEIYTLFLNIQALYLNFYALVYDRASDDFANIVQEVDKELNSFIIRATNGDKYTLYNEISVYSYHPSLESLSRKIYVDYIKYIGTDVKICTCNVCDDKHILSRLDIYYYNFFNDADGISTHIYQGGDIDMTLSLVTFTDQILTDVTKECFYNNINIEVYSNYAPYDYECKYFNQSSDCNITNIENQIIQVMAYGQDLFWVKRLCRGGCELCSYDPDICSLCYNGFYIDENYYCSDCDKTCYSCVKDGECLACKENAYLNSDFECECAEGYGLEADSGDCYACSDENCIVCYSNYQICDKCDDGYFFSDNQCSACDKTCSKCIDNVSCTECLPNLVFSTSLCQCENGYGFLTNTTTCYLCDNPYCTSCFSDNTICTDCDNGHYLENNTCFNCDYKCNTCNESLTCESCKENAFLSEETCVCFDSYGFNSYGDCVPCNNPDCELCQENYDYCTQCSLGYYESFGTCISCSLDCYDCDNSTTCTTCKTNAIGPDTNGQCICENSYGKNLTTGDCDPCIENQCSLCQDNNSQCSQCQDGYYLSNNLCLPCNPSCNTCINDISCISCKDNFTFYNDLCRCNQGYGLDSNYNCLLCHNTCYECYSNNTICETCYDGFYIDSTICHECHNTCLECLNNDSCTTCKNNSHIFENYCECDINYGRDLNGNCSPCENNCEDCTLNNTICSLCYDGYYLESGICLKCENSCADCDLDSSLCTKCYENAFLTNNSVCECESGYGLDFVEGICKVCNEKCELCTGNYDECEVCFLGYGLVLENMTCQACMTGCEECFENALQCTKCSQNYYLNQYNLCETCDNTCKTCTSQSTCESCWDNAEFNNNTCTCISSYGFDSEGKCQQCSNHCTNCTLDYQICLDCEYLYGLNENYTCDHCYDNCINCDNNSQECLICEDGYFLNNNTCEKCLEICKTCSDKNTCLVCDDFSTGPLDGICTCENSYGKNDIGSCERCNDTLCENCAEDKNICKSCGFSASLIGGYCECDDFYGMLSDDCIACLDSKCRVCKNDFEVCEQCVDQANLKDSACACIDHATYNSTERKCFCDSSYILTNNVCEQGYLYLRSSDIQTSLFDSIFSSITITFSSDLDTSSSIICSSILTDTSKLGQGSVCSFPSKNTLKIILGLGWTITENDSLYIFPTKLLRSSGDYVFSYETLIINPKYTSQPYQPTAVITGPSIVSVDCNSVSFEYFSSKSSGISSDTFSYMWTSSMFSEPFTTSFITIFTSDIPSVDSFELFMTITDVFNNTNTAILIIEVISTKTLTVSLDTGSVFTMKSSDAMNIQAKITDFCGQKGSPVYTWTCSQTLSASWFTTTSNKLTIPSKSLPASATPYIFYVYVNLNDITGNNQVSITVTSSPIVILIDRPPGDVTSAKGFSIDASKSYDPDNSNSILSYLWSVTPSSISDITVSTTSSSYSIPGNNLQGQSSFILTLIVSLSDRSSTITNTYTVIDDVNTVIQMIVPNTKIVSSKQLLIKTSITSSENLIIEWSKINGPDITIHPNNFPYLCFTSNTLTMGSVYTFQIKVQESTGKILRSYSTITINIGPECSGSVTSLPYTGTARKTSIKIQINSCRDLDGPDSPLWYTFGFTKGTQDTILKLPSKDNYINTILPSGTLYPYIKVCDNLNDCVVYRSTIAIVINTRRRRLTTSEDLINEFKEHCITYGVINALVVYLDEENTDELLTETMWEEFIMYINNDSSDMDEEYADMVIQIIQGFLKMSTRLKASYDCYEKYVMFLAEILEKKGVIENILGEKVVETASRVLEIENSWEYIKLAHMIVEKVLRLYETPATVGINIQESNIHLIKIEGFTYDVIGKSFTVGSSEIFINNLDANNIELITIEGVLYSYTQHPVTNNKNPSSDTIFVSIYTEHTYNNNNIEDSNKFIFSPIQAKTIISSNIPYNMCDGKCFEDKKLDCSIESYNSTSVTIQVLQSGFYTLYADSLIQSSKIPLYLILSILLFALITTPIIAYTEKNTLGALDTISLDNTIIVEGNNDKTSKSGNIYLDTSIEVPQGLKNKSHLLFSFTSKISNFPRFKRYLLVVSIFVLEIVIENLLFMFTMFKDNVHPIVIGLLAVCLASPLALLSCFLLTNSKSWINYLGMFVLILIQVLSICGGVFLTFDKSWVQACVSGVMLEIFVGQTLLMIGRRVLFS
ncbi:hypothetical protein SteCoe_13456 [Stentor coeruleus]|uniref:EGF-like domain-containing protein n=1 Tax=Stentor coeruleus TaxID=5963 RepID=A0A1R2C8F6_9CILI|nr:hypothetical protein SteCoe_13456 [Stentor coeruleus]